MKRRPKYTDLESARWDFLCEVMEFPEGVSIPVEFNPHHKQSMLRCIGGREALHRQYAGRTFRDPIYEEAKAAYNKLPAHKQ